MKGDDVSGRAVPYLTCLRAKLDRIFANPRIFDNSSTTKRSSACTSWTTTRPDVKKRTFTYDSGNATSRKSVECAVAGREPSDYKMGHPRHHDKQSLASGWRT